MHCLWCSGIHWYICLILKSNFLEKFNEEILCVRSDLKENLILHLISLKYGIVHALMA